MLRKFGVKFNLQRFNFNKNMKKLTFALLIFLHISVNSQETKLLSSKDFQEDLNNTFRDAKKSPLTSEDFANFKSLNFFPINDKLVVQGKFVLDSRDKVYKMKTSTARIAEYRQYATVYFTINEQELSLPVYQSVDHSKHIGYENYLFLPFTDLTNGSETYGGGRYLDMTIPKGTNILLDFNRAYNPYCAYSDRYSCPIVPTENNLNIDIKAGIMKWHD